MSGHYATLLRGTVEAFLPHYDVYITDWTNAREWCRRSLTFDLDDYIDYLIEICHDAQRRRTCRLHTVGVCQPAVPLIAAVALMEADRDPKAAGTTMTLMGGPDRHTTLAYGGQPACREAWQPVVPRQLHPFRCPTLIPASGAACIPGFMQLSGFMAMNIDRHVDAHVEMYNHLVRGDGESGRKAA